MTEYQLTPKVVAFNLSQEGMVQEAYKDSVGVWTWAGGVTDASGHSVLRYKDNPQPIEKCLEVTIWLMREKYLPAVVEVLKTLKKPPTEAQLAAALSFHWNTGKIHRMPPNGWNFHLWDMGGLLRERRQEEADLWYRNEWPSDLTVPVYPVRKPRYFPDFRRGKKIDMMDDIAEVLNQHP